MDRQTLRDWVHRFNASGPDGLIDNWTEGPKPRLSEEQMAEFARVVEAGPDRAKDGVVRWRRIDLVWTAPHWQGFLGASATLVGAAMCPTCLCGT